MSVGIEPARAVVAVAEQRDTRAAGTQMRAASPAAAAYRDQTSNAGGVYPDDQK